MQCSRLKWIVFVAVLIWSVTCASVRAQSAAEMDKARMDAAIRFAETVLKYGRDTYGEKHTPVFTVHLMRTP